MTHDVVVVGDLLVDIVVHPDGPIAPGSDTTSATRLAGGGSAANTASWLAWRGRSVGLVAAVGADALGDHAAAELAAAGVDLLGERATDHPTGTCVVLVDGAERTMLPDRGANDALAPAAVADALAAPPGWIHLSGYALLGQGSRAAGLAAIERARHLGLPWSVDASSAAPLAAVGATEVLGWVEGCTVLFANDDELRALGGVEAVSARVGALAVKHGAAGSSWWADGIEVTAPALATEVVDGVGAGDAFDAGCIDARMRGAAAADSLAAGAVLAARCLAGPGARPQPSA